MDGFDLTRVYDNRGRYPGQKFARRVTAFKSFFYSVQEGSRLALLIGYQTFLDLACNWTFNRCLFCALGVKDPDVNPWHPGSGREDIRTTKTMKFLVFISLSVFYMLCNEIKSIETYYSGWYGASYDDYYYETRDHRQLTMNAYVIAELGDRLVKLKAKLGQLESVPSLKNIYSDIVFRVGRLEGTGCNANQMQCGGNSRQCVSEMLACDGVKDCKNGKDEDPVFCDTSALEVSTTYTATLDLSRCMPGRKHVYNLRSQLRTLHRSKVFPSRLTFTEHVQTYAGEHLVMTSHATGEFQSGSRRFRAYTPGEIGLWSECFSLEDNTEQLYCHTFKSQRQWDLRVPCVRHFIMNAVKTKSKLKKNRYRSVSYTTQVSSALL